MAAIQQLSQDELRHEIVRELITGWKFEEARSRARERAAAQEAQSARGHKSVLGLGKLAGTIPQEDFMRIIAKEGIEFFQDRANVRQFFKRHSHLKAHNI